MAARGAFIVFEGPEGAGKSTQLQRLAEALRAAGRTVETTREPGGTALGQALRHMLLHDTTTAPVPLAELFLYLADRAQHVAQVIAPALARGAIVLCDRFSGSTIAYQAHGRGLALEPLVAADAWVRGGVEPDLVLLLDCPVRIGLARAREADRFHAEEEAFHERVRAGFHALAAADPGRWRTIDTTQPPDTVHAAVLAAAQAVVGDA